MTVGDRIKNARERRGKTQEDIAKIVDTTKQAIYKYENNIVTNIPLDKLETIASALEVSAAYLMGWEQSNTPIPEAANIMPLPKTKKVPLLGDIACGEPILAVENIDEYIDMPEDIRATFALRCKGDSMINARIYDGDIVYIREQPDVESGEIAAVLVDSDSTATLKRVKKSAGKVMLWPENPEYEPLIFAGEEINSIRILGKAVAFTSAVR